MWPLLPQPEQRPRRSHKGEQAEEDRAQAQDAAHPRQRPASKRAVGGLRRGRSDRDRVLRNGARLKMAAQVVQGEARLLERRGRSGRVAVEHREQQMDRVDLVVAQHLGLAVGVDE